MSYDDYIKYVETAYGAKAPTGGKESVTVIQAETPDYVSDSSVYMTNDRTSAINTPSSPSAQLYNVIGANSYNSVGQWAAYTFTVHDLTPEDQQKYLRGINTIALSVWIGCEYVNNHRQAKAEAIFKPLDLFGEYLIQEMNTADYNHSQQK